MPNDPTSRTAARPFAAAVLLLAWLPALAAVLLGGLGDAGWDPIARMVVTALVYGPAAGIVGSIRQWGVATILAGLALTSGWLALLVALREAPAAGSWTDAVYPLAAQLGRLSELAALGLLIWLLGPHPGRRAGLLLGSLAILLEAGRAAAEWAGLAVSTVASPLLIAPLVMALLSFGLGVAGTVGRWWRGGGVGRMVLAWFGLAAGLMLVSYLELVPGFGGFAGGVGTATFVVAQSLLPTAILAAVVGGSGVVIDRRLVEGIVWAQSLGCGVGLYLVANAAALALGATPPVAGGLAAALLALTFSVMLGVLGDLTALVFFGPGISVRRVLARLGDQVSAGDQPGELTGLAEALREVWHLDSVMLTAGTEPTPIATAGTPGGPELVHRIVSGGQPIGAIRCTAADQAVLANLVSPMLARIDGLIGVAVQLAAANQDLAALRRRTREVSRGERRLLHRELHDELAPALAGIGFGLSGVRRQVADGSAAAPAALRKLQDELVATTERVRRLARALLPAALDSGDLDGALRELAGRFSGVGCQVTASAPGTDVLPGADQIAVYLVLADVVELLVREAGATRIRIEVTLDDTVVAARLAAEPPPGSADLQAALLRRVSEAGGTLAVDGAAGRVTVVVPR